MLISSSGSFLNFIIGTRVGSLGRDDALEEEMATYSSILAWEIPWTEEPGGLQFRGWQTSWTRPSD